MSIPSSGSAPKTVQGVDFKSQEFIQNPSPTYGRLRASAPILARDDWGIVFLSRYENVNALLRERQLGRQFSHVMSREDSRN